MSKLNFSDDVSIDTSGPYRTLELYDGWYVVGNGTLSPCRDEAAAKAELAALVGRDLVNRRVDSPVWD